MNVIPYPSMSTGSAIPESNPFAEMMTGIGNAYAMPFQATAQELWTSSARIVQEHAMRAMVNASQDCMTALAENAAALQQRAVGHMFEANAKAMEAMSTAFTKALTSSFPPAG